MSITKEAKVALLIIGSAVIFVLGANFLKGSRFAVVDPIYYATYDNVESLYKSSKIFINGVQVGIIKDIEFENKKTLGKIKVTMQFNGKFPIPVGSKAVLYSTDFFGNKAIRIDLAENTTLMKEGSLFESEVDKGMLGSLGDKVSPIATNADKLLSNANTLFDKQQQINVYNTINGLNQALAALKTTINGVNTVIDKNEKSVTKTLENLASISSNIEKKNDEISSLINNLNSISGQVKNADISKTFGKLNKSLDEFNQLLASVNDGNGTLTKLIKDPVLHNKLVETVNSANNLVVDLKANPKRYVSFSLIGKKQ